MLSRTKAASPSVPILCLEKEGPPMRRPADLSRHELELVADAVQQALYLRYDPAQQSCCWDPDLDWSGFDVCAQLADVLSRVQLIPTECSPFHPTPPDPWSLTSDDHANRRDDPAP